MANAKIDWVQADKVSIRKAARTIGFDIEEIDNNLKHASDVLVRRTRAEVIYQLEDAWYDAKGDGFSEVLGVYVISLTDNIFIDYGNNKISPVLYIGQGRIKNRLSTHFQGSLFDFSRTLNDVNFKVYMGIATAKGRGETYIDAEFRLIEHFEKTYGNKPLLNNNRGIDTKRKHRWQSGWNKPLKNSGKLRACRWTIKPRRGSKGQKWYKELT